MELAEWETRFLRAVGKSPAARAAWAKLSAAALEGPAKIELFYYANFGALSQAYLAAKRVQAKAFRRADRAREVAADRQADPREAMFRARAERAEAEALGLTPAFGVFRADARAHVAADAADAVRRHDGAQFLAVLKFGAARFGVALGSEALAALASCASGAECDPADLRRFLRSDETEMAAEAYAQQFVLLTRNIAES